MARAGSLTSVALFIISGLAFSNSAHSASCDAIVGKWIWFIGGEVTINSDGTFTQQSGNGGTWTCTDASKGMITLKWNKGGYVNRMVLSDDDTRLASTDPSQQFVTAKRTDVGGTAPIGKRESSAPVNPTVILTTQPDGMRQLPKDLPELVHAATERARVWRRDAIPVSVKFTHRDAPNPTMRGPEVRISYSSPAEGIGLIVPVTADGPRTFEINKPVNWGVVTLPPVFVDLPAAVRIAREHGMKGQVNRASLDIWSPSGVPPILAWIVGNKTVNGATGEIIDYDVTGYIKSYNAQWEQAAKSLRALMQRVRGGSSSNFPAFDGSNPSDSGSDRPYDDGSAAREEHERNAAESRVYWGGSAEDYNRVKNGECTWSDSSNYGC